MTHLTRLLLIAKRHRQTEKDFFLPTMMMMMEKMWAKLLYELAIKDAKKKLLKIVRFTTKAKCKWSIFEQKKKCFLQQQHQ